MVFLLPLCAIYDRLYPWPPAVRALMEYSGQKRLCVGYGGEKDVEYSNRVTTEKSETQRAFILFPSVFMSPKMIFITENQDGKITKIESLFGFWFLFLTYAVCLWSTWHFWIRPHIKKSR
jgi:hypothetical protein